MKRTFLDNIIEGLTAIPTSQRNEVLFFANAHFLFFNFYAPAHCTHLPLLADTQANPKAKSKECNRQRLDDVSALNRNSFLTNKLN
jgi:hypothetical protein